ADDATMRQWETVARQMRADAEKMQDAGQVPRLFFEDVATGWGRSIPNHALGPLAMSRALVPVGQAVKFSSRLHLGPTADGRLPQKARVSVDAEWTQDVRLATNLE